jgi:hypothetical protein
VTRADLAAQYRAELDAVNKVLAEFRERDARVHPGEGESKTVMRLQKRARQLEVELACLWREHGDVGDFAEKMRMALDWDHRRAAQRRLRDVQGTIRRLGYTTGELVMMRGQARDDVLNTTTRIRRRIADLRAEDSWIESGARR